MKNIATTEEFNSVIQGGQPVIVKLEAGWCPDCKAMNMWIDPIVDRYNDYKWYSVSRGELEGVASDDEVMGILSLFILESGQKQAHLHSVNAKSPEQVRSFLRETSNK